MALDGFAVSTRFMTSDEVLTALVHWLNFDMHFGRDRDYRVLTIKQFRRCTDAFSHVELGQMLGEWFALSNADWSLVLTPEKTRTVGDLCDFLSHHVRRPVIEPLTIAGSTSLSAGVFLAVRQVFADAGVDAQKIRPSTDLSPFLTSHGHVLTRLSCLAPERVPRPYVVAPMHEGVAFAAMLLSVGGLASLCLGGTGWRGSYCVVVGLVCRLTAWFLAKTIRPREIGLPWIRNFRELSQVIAGERNSGAPGFPVA